MSMNRMNVEFLQRVNDGNFEHRELKISAMVDGDNHTILGAQVHGITNFVRDVLAGKYASHVVETVKEGKIKVAKIAPNLQNGKGDEVPQEDIKPIEAKEKEKEEVTSEVKDEEKKTSTKEKAAKAPKKETTAVTKGKGGKEEVYSRDNDSHKNQLASWLDEDFPGWDDEDTIKKFGDATRKLVGTPFRDKDGEILETFKTALKSLVE